MTRSTEVALKRRATLSVLGGALLGGCSQPSARAGNESPAEPSAELSGEIRIAGSSTVYPLTLEVGERFTERHPAVSVSLASTGTGGGFSEFFCQGRTDINGASRPITASERQDCADAGVDFLELQVATDALTVIVNTDADWIDCVTPAELAAIWRADGVDRWSEIREAWPDEEIERYGPSSDSGTFDYFAEEIVGDVADHRQDYLGTEQDSTIVSNVEESTYAIGYLGFAYYIQNDRAVDAVAIDGGEGCVSPSLDTAESGTYAPLSRPLFVYISTDSLADPTVRSFLRFYLASTDTDLVSDVGYVPLDSAVAERERSKLVDAIGE